MKRTEIMSQVQSEFSERDLTREEVATLFASEYAKPRFHAEVSRLFGNHASVAIVLEQTYWRWVMKGRRAFYKFFQPAPNNNFYKHGDSWTEETGLSVDTIASVMKDVATKVSGKEAALKALKGKELKNLIVYYTDRYHITWFYFNENLWIELVAFAKKRFQIRIEERDALELAHDDDATEAFYDNIISPKVEVFARPNHQTGISEAPIGNLPIGNTEQHITKSKESETLHSSASHTEESAEKKFAPLQPNGEVINYYTDKEDITSNVKNVEQVRKIEETNRKIESDKKRKEQQSLFNEQMRGVRLDDKFELEVSIILEAIEFGYTEEDLKSQFSKLKAYFVSGKGKYRKVRDWNRYFLDSWMQTAYDRGDVTRDGKLAKGGRSISPADARLAELQRKASTDTVAKYAHLSDAELREVALRERREDSR